MIKIGQLISNWFNHKKTEDDHKSSEELISPSKIISFKAGYDLTELPIISLYQDGKTFNFLLDTGSNDSIIDSNVLDKIQYALSDRQSELYGMEGKPQKVDCCSITLSYGNDHYTYEYVICDMKEAFSRIKAESGVTLHGIIGSKFFNAYKYVLDFESLIAYSKKQC